MIVAVLMVVGVLSFDGSTVLFTAVFSDKAECERTAEGYNATHSHPATCVSPETAKLNGWKP